MKPGRPKGSKTKPLKFPEGVTEGVMHDLAHENTRKKGVIDKIATKWGLTAEQAIGIQQRNKHDLNVLRSVSAERSMLVGMKGQEILMEKLHDQAEMKLTPAKDLGRIVKDLNDSAVTLLEGHQHVAVNIPFAEVLKARERLDAREAERRANQKAIPA